MPEQHSAGILLFRRREHKLEVLLVHPGGPFWAHKDLGAWSIPKGVIDGGEDLLEAALREFQEETGFAVQGEAVYLGDFPQPSGKKIVHAWAVEQDLDAARIVSNTFQLEWPKGSGQTKEFPEIDRAAWFDIGEAKQRILPGQVPILQKLIELLEGVAEKGKGEG